MVNVTIQNLIKNAGLNPDDVLLIRHSKNGDNKDASFRARLWHINNGYIKEFTSLQKANFPQTKYIMSFIGGTGTTARLDNFYEVKKPEILTKEKVMNFFDANYKEVVNEIFPEYLSKNEKALCIDLEELETFKEYHKRLVIDWGGATTSWYQYGNNIKDIIMIAQKKVIPFCGFDNLLLNFSELQGIIANEEECYNEWHSILKASKAIYLITDKKTGLNYVGSATGDEGLFQRWTDYSKDGHGENIDLKKLDFKYIKENFQYAVLEILNSRVCTNPIERENWWKKVLCSKEHGYNKN